MSTGPPAQDQYIFQFLFRTREKFKNLIRTSKFKFSFQGLGLAETHAFFFIWGHHLKEIQYNETMHKIKYN